MPNWRASRSVSRPARSRSPPAHSLRPQVEDDQELYERRALSMTWTRGRRELAFSGRLPLEQGIAFEQAIWSIAKQQRAADKQAGTILDWQQSAADALVTLARQGGGTDGAIKRSPTTVIVHISDGRARAARGRGAAQPRNRRAARLRRAPPHDQAKRPRPHAHARRALCLLRAAARIAQALAPLPVPRLHRRARTRGAPRHPGRATAARPSSTTSSSSAPATTNSCTTTTSARAATPSTPPSPTQPGRAITTNQPHAPPC